MNIGINLLAESLQKAGTGRYAFGLLSGLSQLDTDDKFTIFLHEKNLQNFWIDDPRFEYVKFRYPVGSAAGRRFFEQFVFPFRVGQYKLDKLLSVNNLAPALLLRKSIVTVMDIATWVTPERFALKKRAFLIFYNFFSWITLNFCRRIITISEFSRGQILNKFKRRTKTNTEVVMLGVDDVFRREVTDAEVKKVHQKFTIRKPYIFAWSTIERSKNYERLFEAFAKLGREDLQLVIAGKKSNYWEKIQSKIAELNLEEKVVMTGYVSDEEVTALIKGSEFIVFPSLYEGAGLPPIEAMAVGKAVVSSNATAIGEYSGDAALQFDPQNLEDMIGNIQLLLSNRSVIREYEEKGRKWSQNFTWPKTAARTLKLIKDGSEKA